jgi:hypothetical protein
MHRVVNRRHHLLCCAVAAALLLLPSTGIAEEGEEGKGAPSAGRVGATEVATDSARVAGTVQLGKGSASYWFEYGTTPALGQRTAVGVATHEQDDKQHQVAVTRVLAGLAPATTYYVRLVASSSSGRGAGSPTSFSTAAGAPGAPPQAPEQPPVGPPASTVAPQLGERFVAAAARGTVRVRVPGATAFTDLAQATAVPVGSVVDARAGTLAITAALPGGAVQAASFRGGRFKVDQADGGRTDLYLRGGSFARCRTANRTLAVAAGKRPKPVRHLWGRDRGGRFRTHGRDSVATVRGTRWSMTDRCDGTLTRVREGAVDVRVRRTGRIVRVHAGERHLARHVHSARGHAGEPRHR